MPEHCGHSYESDAIALSERCGRDVPPKCLSPEFVGAVEIFWAPPRLCDLPFAEMKDPYVLAVVVVITTPGGNVRQCECMIITGGCILKLLSEGSSDAWTSRPNISKTASRPW